MEKTTAINIWLAKLKLRIWEKVNVSWTLQHGVKKRPQKTSSSYLLVAEWPVSEESEPGDHPAPVPEVSRQSAPRYDTP